MLYQNYETDISKKNLSTVFNSLPEPICLLGGWAVYLTVNDNFNDENGQSYHGSKDIDLGFHLDEKVSDFKETTFYKAINVLEKIGFIPVSQRYIKYYKEDGTELTEEQSKKIAQPFLFNLYVDPIVDRIIEGLREAIGYVPIDEPLLQHVFEKKQFKLIEEFGSKIILPSTELLLATKINAVPNRTKDHKRIKDIADIFALIAYGDKSPRQALEGLRLYHDLEHVQKVFSEFTDEELRLAAEAIGIEIPRFTTVMKGFISTARS